MIPTVTKAQFTYKGLAEPIVVDFNPASLDYTITINTQGEGGQAQQAGGVASAKLNFELLFDTTDTGDDVRTKTNKVEIMLRPQAGKGGKNAPRSAPPMVTFEWGAFKFVGVVDSFKQTMDFFGPEGLPLRAAVSLSMSQPNYNFDQQGATDSNGNPITSPVNAPLIVPDGSPSQLATDAGDPDAARSIASANGLESLRASAGGEISVGGGISIGAAASFSAGASANAGLGADIGFGASAGAGFSIGGALSAGISATDGAFNGLHSEATAAGGKFLETKNLLASVSAPGIAPGTLFDVSGKAIAQSSSTFKTNVGASTGAIRFDDN